MNEEKSNEDAQGHPLLPQLPPEVPEQASSLLTNSE